LKSSRSKEGSISRIELDKFLSAGKRKGILAENEKIAHDWAYTMTVMEYDEHLIIMRRVDGKYRSFSACRDGIEAVLPEEKFCRVYDRTMASLSSHSRRRVIAPPAMMPETTHDVLSHEEKKIEAELEEKAKIDPEMKVSIKSFFKKNKLVTTETLDMSFSESSSRSFDRER
jgi:hypothetical protein